jgi:phage terminase Nu1 subunit (DNA packaging protein)
MKEAGAAFRKRLQQAQDRVWQLRARRKSNQAIFSATIEYLLSKGPLSTVELHPLIQRLHPDICDDSIDRVIGNVNFGKRWKHHVRSAQQYLKRNHRIFFDGARWHLSEGKEGGG